MKIYFNLLEISFFFPPFAYICMKGEREEIGLSIYMVDFTNKKPKNIMKVLKFTCLSVNLCFVFISTS